MSASHTTGRVTFKADGDANHYSMLTEDGKWWLAILRQWSQHNPFQRASADLIRKVQRVQREIKHQRQTQQPQGEPAPF